MPAASIAAAVGVFGHLAATSPAPAPPAPAPAAAEVGMVGQVVAVAPDSITTRGADGHTVTFRITPDTSQVSASGRFAVDQTVTVLSTTNAGTPVATAVAEQGVTGGNGMPMDSDSGI